MAWGGCTPAFGFAELHVWQRLLQCRKGKSTALILRNFQENPSRFLSTGLECPADARLRDARLSSARPRSQRPRADICAGRQCCTASLRSSSSYRPPLRSRVDFRRPPVRRALQSEWWRTPSPIRSSWRSTNCKRRSRNHQLQSSRKGWPNCKRATTIRLPFKRSSIR